MEIKSRKLDTQTYQIIILDRVEDHYYKLSGDVELVSWNNPKVWNIPDWETASRYLIECIKKWPKYYVRIETKKTWRIEATETTYE